MVKRKFLIIFLFLCCCAHFSALGAQPLEIWQIQGEGNVSPYLNQVAATEENVVTARGNGFFFIQTPAERSDNNPLTSDGILVNAHYSGQVGDIVTVSGRIWEIDGSTMFSSSGLQVTTVGSGGLLPAPVLLDNHFPSAAPAPVHDLERVEGMLVQFSAIASGPSDGLELVPLTAGGQRPFREPGILRPGLPGLPEWDGNPELFWFDPNGLNAPNNRFVNTGAAIEATAVMVEAGQGFWLALPTSYTLANEPLLRAVRPTESNEFTVGSLNCLQLFSYAGNYTLRLQKLARYITELMRLPDILALQEVGSLSALQDLAYYIKLQAPQSSYQAYLMSGNGDIKLGFLVSSRIQGVQVSQLGADEALPFGGLLHDRPPALLEASLPTSPPTPIRVLNLHMRSLIGIEGPDAGFVRTKRHQQAMSVANMVQALQQAGNLVVVGDFNAYEFTDGYVDVANQIAGQPSLGALYAPVPIVAPPLQKMIESLPSQERYSYVYQGNAQAIDHCLAGAMDGLAVKGMEYARGNADNALAYADNAFLPQRCSDHDGLVLFLEALNPVSAAEAKTGSGIRISHQQPLPAGGGIRIQSESGELLFLELFLPTGQKAWQTRLSGWETTVLLPHGLPAASWYGLQVVSEKGRYAGKVVRGRP